MRASMDHRSVIISAIIEPCDTASLTYLEGCESEAYYVVQGPVTWPEEDSSKKQVSIAEKINSGLIMLSAFLLILTYCSVDSS